MKKSLPLSLLPLAFACTAEHEPVQPNIIFILADDLGYGDITPYGQQYINTPNLDSLASKGTVFTNCYAGCTVSAPSRASLMTGLHTGHTFVRGNYEIYPEGQYPLPEGTQTIGGILSEAGYETGIFGKWGLGFPGSGSEPSDMGFDTFYGYNCQRKSHSHYPEYLWDNQRRDTLYANLGRARKEFAPDLIHAKAKDFIIENSGQPFFAFLSYTLPHAELCTPEDSIWLSYREKFKDTPEDYYGWTDNGDYYSSPHPLTSFASMVTRLDLYVGDIMDLLDELGIAENTIIVFSSDNGPHREGGANPYFFDSNSIYRGTKRDLYEGGIRVPMIVYGPSMIPQGRVSEKPMAFWDLMPTFAEIAGTASPSGTDGISMLKEWKGEDNDASHDFLYWEFHEEGGKQAVRVDEWKGVMLGISSGNPRFELYNLKDDPSETVDLSNDYPEIVNQMKEIMQREHLPSELFPFPGDDR